MYAYLGLAALLLAGLLVRRLATHFRQQRKAKELGCEPVTRRPHRLPLGIDFIQEIAAAAKEDKIPIYFEAIADHMAPVRTFKSHILGTDSIMTVEPANVKALLATQFKDFDLGPRRKGCFSPLFGHGIFSDDGERWERSRTLIRPSFAREQLANVESLERHVQNLMLHLQTTAGLTNQVDLKPLFFRFTLDSSTELLFGQSVDSQLASLAEVEDSATPPTSKFEWSNFGPSFDEATDYISFRFRLNAMYWLYDPKGMRDACSEVHRFADHFVRLALQPKTEKDIEVGNSDKHPYVFLHELAKSTQDPTELRDQLLNVLLAGRDTTAGLLGFTWLQLARHPDIYAKLRSIILNDFGTYDSPRNLDFTGLKACTYLQHTLNEALRLHPAVPINARRAKVDTSLPSGGGPDGTSPIFVPAGMEVNYSVHAMHRRRDLWGPDANEFKPERWRERKAGWEFLPFNGGPRICLGQQSALSTAAYITVRLAQRFDQLVDLVPHDEVTGREKYWTTVTDAPLHVKLRLREARLSP